MNDGDSNRLMENLEDVLKELDNLKRDISFFKKEMVIVNEDKFSKKKRLITLVVFVIRISLIFLLVMILKKNLLM